MILTPAQADAVMAFWQAADENDFEFSDNYRYAVPGDKAQEAAYEEQRQAGCCGAVDTVLNCSDGTQLMFGFNYGH